MLQSALDDVKRMNKRQFLYQVLSFGMIVSSALMIWKGLMVVTGSESPIVVVLSGSMEPAFHRGDLLFLTNYQQEPVRVGEIVVFKVEGRDIPIVHRVLKLHEKENGTVKFLTKGDNNSVDDRGLYAPGQLWLTKKDVVGRARGFLPYVGMVTIYMNEYPKFKYFIGNKIRKLDDSLLLYGESSKFTPAVWWFYNVKCITDSPYVPDVMLRVSDMDDATARRKDRERAMLEEGEALWRAKQRQQWISRLQEQREARDMLLTYSPWGRPGCGAPNTEDPRKKKLQDILSSSNQNNNQGALTMGRPGCGAPLRTRSGRLQTVVRVDPMIRFHDPSRRCIDNEIRYRSSPHQQLAYRTQLDTLVMERRKAQAEARKGSTQELRHMLMAPAPWGRPGPGGAAWRQQRSTQLNFLHSLGWSSDPTLCALAHSVNSKGKVTQDEDHTKPSVEEEEIKEKQIILSPVKQSRLKPQQETNNGAGLELVPLLARRRGVLAIHHPSSRHPLCSTDITRHDVPGIPEPKYHEDRDYLQDLRRQVACKQKKLEEMRKNELQTSQQHFETWRQFWGRPGHGAPKLPVPRMTLAKLLSSDEIPPFKPPR